MSSKQITQAIARWRQRKRKRRKALTAAQRRLKQLWRNLKTARKREAEEWLWGGSRAVTNEVIRIVGNRASITSRKRTETFGNPDSDHHVSQKHADAVDFGIAEAHWLKNEISRRLGGPNELADFGSFNVRRNGHTYRVQIIAATHGTGPHLHVGVRRAA